MSSRELTRLAVVAATSLLSAACATTSYTRSSVTSVPPGLKGKAGADATLEIEGLKLRIETLDRAPVSREIPQLAIRLVFDPRVLGYSFDPGQVALRASDGAAWRPRVSGPGTFLTGPWSCSGDVSSDDAPRSHLLAPRSCFELAFDVALAPEQRLELEIGGLARGRTRIEPVRLRLARRAGRSLDRVYWLEAVGAVLAAPLALAGGGL
jgi:hypothetical protein